MAVDIGPKIGIDGEAEFRKQIQDCNQALKTLGSEMKLVTAEFAAGEESEDSLTKKNDVLSRSVSTLQEKLALQSKALQECANMYGEADSRTMKWQQAVNETNAALADTENKIKANEDAMSELGESAEQTGKDIEEAGDKGSSFGEKLAAGCTAALAVLGAVATAAGALAKEVVSSYGDLEQSIGGSEAVFGDYANNIQRWSESAFRTMGVSQSEYLATANKIGALFQGAGMDQREALTMTADAMQRAADMASVMGINTEDALNAIAGAAKGNYTMMDNLGVAMNNTALAAYAEEKGFKKLFSEMDNAEKAEVAMQYFFENTSQYAGNFAREAEQTLSGSLGMFDAARESLIAGLGNSDANIAQLTGNVLNALSSVINNVVPVLENLAGALPTVIKAAIDQFGPMIPELVNTGMELVNAVLDGVLQVLPQLSKAAIDIIKQFVAYILENLDALVDGGIEILNALIDGIIEMIPELAPVAVDTILKLVDSLISNVNMLVDAAIEIIFALADGLIASLPALLDKAPEIVQKLVKAIIDNAPKLLESALELILKLVNGIIDNLDKITQAALDIAETLLQGLADSFVAFVEMGGNLVKGLIEGFNNWFDWAWGKIKEWFNNVIDRVKSWLGIHSPSTKFAELGKYSALGFGEGFEDEFSEVSQKVVGDIQKAYDKAYAAARKSIDGQVKLFDHFAAEVKEDTASVEQMLEAWADQTSNLDRYTRNLKKAAEYGIDHGLVESLSDGSTKSAAYLDTIISRIEELGVTTDGMGEDAQKFVNEFNGAFRRTGEAKDTFAKTATEISGAADDIKNNVAVVNGVIAELQEQYNETYESARDSIEGQVKLFDEFAGKISEETDSVEKMTALWETQAQNLENYSENLRKATSYGVDKRLIEQLSDGSAESVGYIATIVEHIEQLGGANEETLQFVEEFNAAFQQTQTAKDNFAATVADIESNLVEVVDFAKEESKEFKTTGEAMIAAMIKGLDNKCGNLYGKVMQIVGDALSYANLATTTFLPDASANAGVISSMQGTGVTNAMADSVNALGTLMGGNNGNLNIVIQADGREFYRATIDDFRLIQSENPVVMPV